MQVNVIRIVHQRLDDQEGRTPLHLAISNRRGVEVVRELLKSGESANAWDAYKCTPLIFALKFLDSDLLDTVKELLKYGANPNVHDFQGYSALTLALYKKNLKVIQEMMEFGADINLLNKPPIRCFLMFLTPMTEAVRNDLGCAKILIKMTVLKHFDNNYNQIINLNRFSDARHFKRLTSFLEECTWEVHQMKSYLFNNKCSIFEYVINSRKCFKPLYCDENILREILNCFCIYQDTISTNLQPCLLRGRLLNKLRVLRIYAVYNNNKTVNNSTGKVYLNEDCSLKIAEYLTNDELCAFNQAYDI